MGQKYVKYSREFRETALRRLSVAANVAQLCRELGSRASFCIRGEQAGSGTKRKATAPNSGSTRRTFS